MSVFRVDERQILDAVENLPGTDIIEKIVASSSVACYVAARSNLDRETFIKLMEQLYALTVREVKPFDDLDNPAARQALKKEIEGSFLTTMKSDPFEKPTKNDFQ
jgi:hypothetical protein